MVLALSVVHWASNCTSSFCEEVVGVAFGPICGTDVETCFEGRDVRVFDVLQNLDFCHGIVIRNDQSCLVQMSIHVEKILTRERIDNYKEPSNRICSIVELC